MSKVSIKSAVRKAVRDDSNIRLAREKFAKTFGAKGSKTRDSFQNFAAQLGIGTDTLFSASGYGFNPITRWRTILEWMHRGSWLCGVAIDIIGDDMTKMGVDLRGDIAPQDIDHLERAAVTWNIWNDINDTIKWSRLYGGCLALMLIDGQDTATPLNIDRVGRRAFKGHLVLDRWMVEPSLNDLVTDYGPDMGMPKYYFVTADAPAIPRMKIHYSRCLRLEGVRLPYWQRLTENLWGISVLERLYDRMVAFDSATTGMAQLIYKSYLRTYGIDGLREIVAAGGDALIGLTNQINFMRQTQSIEGITLMDAKDEFQTFQHSAFGGLAECIIQLGQQLSGSLQIPLVRLFGQSPVGMNSTGESDLRTYYDGIRMRQERELRIPLTRAYRVLARSEGIRLDEGFKLEFRPLWIMDDMQKVTAGAQLEAAIGAAFDRGGIDHATYLKELRQGGKPFNMWTNITDEMIEEAEMEPPPSAQMALEQGGELDQEQEETEAAGGSPNGNGNGRPKAKAKGKSKDRKHKTKDRILSTGAQHINNFPVIIEQDANDERAGRRLPAAYGFIQRTGSAEGRDEQMDCFVGPVPSEKIFIVDSYRQDGSFDEHKVMFSFARAEDAIFTFRSYYSTRRCICSLVSEEQLRRWLIEGDMKRPYAQPTDVKYTHVASNMKEQCSRCEYFQLQMHLCTNSVVARDPKIPETLEGLKLVSPTGWCEEFETKENDDAEQVENVIH